MNHADLDLLQRVLDDDATPEEQASLEARMTAEPALRERFDSMASLFLALDDEVLEPAPASLRDDVLNALTASPRRETRFANRAKWSWSRMVLPLASAAAALALIVTAMRLVPSPLAPDGRTAGTMYGVTPRPVRFELPVERAGFHITASRESKGIAWLEMATDAPVAVSLSSVRGTVEFEGLELPAGISESVPPARQRGEWQLKPGVKLRVRCSLGPSPVFVNVRVESPGGASCEVGIHLESLPIVRLP